MKYYAIRTGRKNNIIVTSWDECSKLVTGFPKAVFKSFKSWQEDDAIKFAQSGSYENQSKPKAKPKIKLPRQNKPWGKCVEWKSYRDTLTGMFYKNRCVVKLGGTVVGENYIESDDTSCPF